MSSHIGKAEFVDQIQTKIAGEESMSMTKSAITTVLDAALEQIKENSMNDIELRLKNFGTFKTQILAAKTGKNHLTGKEMNIPSRKKISFKMSNVLKDELNHQTA